MSAHTWCEHIILGCWAFRLVFFLQVSSWHLQNPAVMDRWGAASCVWAAEADFQLVSGECSREETGGCARLHTGEYGSLIVCVGSKAKASAYLQNLFIKCARHRVNTLQRTDWNTVLTSSYTPLSWDFWRTRVATLANADLFPSGRHYTLTPRSVCCAPDHLLSFILLSFFWLCVCYTPAC